MEEPKTAAQSAWSSQRSDNLDYLTELAIRESQNWIEIVTGKPFKFPYDFRRSLESGVLLLELLNGLRGDTIRRINRLPSPIAGLDNINVFLEACQTHFGLKDSQLFHSCDLEDLSIRAVSDCEDQLKLETDRRLRNVAITIFWLGKVSRKYDFYRGPQLNLSVFADILRGGQSCYPYSPPATPCLPSLSASLENVSRPGVYLTPLRTPSHPQTPSGDVLPARDESSDSLERSSAYGSFRSEGAHPGSWEGVVDDGSQGNRDDSLRSDRSTTSDYHEEVFLAATTAATPTTDSKMPVRHEYRRQGTAPTTSGTASQRLADSRHAASVDDGRYGYAAPRENQYGEEDFRRLTDDQRTSSNSSLDRHVRENDMMATRLGARKSVGAAANPLQFIKAAGTPLAEQAKETVHVMEKQKEQKKVVQTQDEDWQSNLSNWKSKMRKKSSTSLTRAQESEELFSAEDDVQNRRKSKTFKEMMEERERRKSGVAFYPSEDQEEILAPPKSHNTRPRDSNDETLSAFGFTKVDDPSQSKPTESAQTQRSYFSSRKVDNDGYNVSKETVERTKTQRSFHGPGNQSNSSIVKLTKSSVTGQSVSRFGPKDSTENAETENLDRISVPRTKAGKKAWSWERKSVTDEEASEEVPPWAHDEDSEMLRVTTKTTVAPDSQSFRGGSATYPLSPPSPRDSTDLSHTYTKVKVQHEQSSAPVASVTDGDHGSDYRSARSMFEKPQLVPDPEPRLKPATLPRSAIPPQVGGRPPQVAETSPRAEELVMTSTARRSYELPEAGDRSSGQWSQRASTDRVEDIRKLTSRGDNVTAPTPSRQTSQSDKKNIEKIIKISQKPNHDKGFGFTIRGGKEFASPIVVEKVILGGAADVCELMPGDEVVAINGASVSNHYKDSVELVINQAVRLGQIELKIRRSLANFGQLDQEELQLEKEQQLLKASYSRFTSVSSTSSEQATSPVQSPHSPLQPALRPTPKPAPRRTQAPEPAPRQQLDRQPLAATSTGVYDIMVERAVTETRASHRQPVARRPRSPGGDSVTSEDMALEREVMEQLELEDNSTTLNGYGMEVPARPQTPEPDDEPPPLPAAPPPVPNWTTFPGGGVPADLDPADLVPDTTRRDPESAQTRMDNLRRKAEFLGSRVEAMEEYHKLQEELALELQGRVEESEWQRIEQQEHLSASSLMSRFDRLQSPVPPQSAPEPAAEPQRAPVVCSQPPPPRQVVPPQAFAGHTVASPGGQAEYDVYPESESAFTVGREEMEIIEKLEQVGRHCQARQDEIRREEERNRQQEAWSRQNEPWSPEQVHGWRTMEQLSPSSDDHGPQPMTAPGAKVHDPQSAVSDCVLPLVEGQPKPDIQSSHRFFNLDEERERMQQWTEEQERKLKEQFDRDQERMNEAHEKDLKRVEQVDIQHKIQEEKLLEKELSRQRELEEIKRRRDENRERNRLDDEDKQREEEQARREKQAAATAASRDSKVHEEFTPPKARAPITISAPMMKELSAEEEAQQRERERKAERERLRQIEDDKRRQEAELQHKEAELKARQAALIRQREEEQRRKEAELRQREAELRQREAEQQQRKEAERTRHAAVEIENKSQQLREREERLRKEEEDFRRQKEMIHSEKLRTSTDEVSVSYSRPESVHRGDFEYVYKGDSPTPMDDLMSAAMGHPEQNQSVITERTERYEIRSASQVEPPSSQDSSLPIKPVRKDPSIPPKPGIKAELSGISRRDIMDMNRQPGAVSGPRVYEDSYQYSNTSPQTATRPANRKSWSPDTAASELSYIRKHPDLVTPSQPAQRPVRREANGDSQTTPMSRAEMLAFNRKVFPRKDYAAGGASDRYEAPPQVTGAPAHTMTKRELHSVGAAPRSRVMSSEQWIRDEPAKPARRSEILRQSLPSLSDHWLVEEAERRRIAEHTGQERPTVPTTRQGGQGMGYGDNPESLEVLAPPQGYPVSQLSRSWQGSREQTPQRVSPSRSLREDSPQHSSHSYSQKHPAMSSFRGPTQGVTLVTEVEKPELYIKPQRPIPDDIMQSLLDRVHVTGSSRSLSHTTPPTQTYPQHPSAVPRASLSSQVPQPPTRDNYPAAPYTGHPADRPSHHHYPPPPLGYQDPPHPPAASSGGSAQTWERAPLVPPKPPRLTSDSDEPHAEQVVSVSGSLGCSHCDNPLGRGAAMVIESLGLRYHMACFRCCVCQAKLGGGHSGADVRVRVSKLHCANCYSYDEVGLKYSRV